MFFIFLFSYVFCYCLLTDHRMNFSLRSDSLKVWEQQRTKKQRCTNSDWIKRLYVTCRWIIILIDSWQSWFLENSSNVSWDNWTPEILSLKSWCGCSATYWWSAWKGQSSHKGWCVYQSHAHLQAAMMQKLFYQILKLLKFHHYSILQGLDCHVETLVVLTFIQTIFAS